MRSLPDAGPSRLERAALLASAPLLAAAPAAAQERDTTAAATGAFRFDDVPPGDYLAGFFHPRLDSLGLKAPTYLVTVDQGETPLVLALPVPGTIVRAACGAIVPWTRGTL